MCTNSSQLGGLGPPASVVRDSIVPLRQARKRLTTRGRCKSLSRSGTPDVYPCYCYMRSSTCLGSLASADRACRRFPSEDGRNFVFSHTQCRPHFLSVTPAPRQPCLNYHRRDAIPQYHRAAATMLQLACDHDWWAQGRPRRLRPDE